jgi:hypothetical protein
VVSWFTFHHVRTHGVRAAQPSATMVVTSDVDVFSTDDLHELSALVATAWRARVDLDWSAPAGTLEWSCTRTADHAVDTLFAPA